MVEHACRTFSYSKLANVSLKLKPQIIRHNDMQHMLGFGFSFRPKPKCCNSRKIVTTWSYCQKSNLLSMIMQQLRLDLSCMVFMVVVYITVMFVAICVKLNFKVCQLDIFLYSNCTTIDISREQFLLVWSFYDPCTTLCSFLFSFNFQAVEILKTAREILMRVRFFPYSKSHSTK